LKLHSWQVSVAQAMDIQRKLADRVSTIGEGVSPSLVAGVDMGINKAQKTGTAAVVVLSYPDLSLVELSVVTERLEFPYVPGLLSFREAPLLLAACEKLRMNPDIIMVDGQGMAHPRRLGLACHLGLFLNTPTIGCAKSRLCGRCQEPGNAPGDHSELVDREEVIGAVVRTRAGVKPVYVSVGHKIDLADAVNWVFHCCRGYRLPEPTRLAHLAAGGNLKVEDRNKAPGQ